MNVSFLVSDPWEFGTECGVGPFHGMVVLRNEKAILIRLSHPILYKGNTLTGVIASPRYGQSVDDLYQSDDPMHMNFSLVGSLDPVALDRAGSTGVQAVGTVQVRK